MKLSLALIAVTASSSSARINEARHLQSDPPIACPAIENPVCGSDGITYANDCVANATGVEVAYTGQCYCDLVDEDCYPYTGGKPACCTVSNAICGVDKPPCQTGASYCYDMPDFSCYQDGHPQCCLDENGKVSPTAAETCAGERDCDITTTTSTPAGIACPFIIDTVCGANGVNYDNECLAEAAGTTVASKGECPCPKNLDPVCGVNGSTYDNECLAIAAGTTVASQGACPPTAALTAAPSNAPSKSPSMKPSSTPSEKPSLSPSAAPSDAPSEKPTASPVVVACPLIISKVCGSNGMTYDNECLAEAAGTTVASEGECPVACPLIISKVCGVDGATYDNECLAEAAGTTVASEGECSAAVPCTMEYAPVCGEDGETYGNKCMADAANVTIVSEGECRPPLITPMNVTDTSANDTAAPTATPSTDTGAVGVKNDPVPSSASAAVFHAASVLVASVFIYALI